MSALKTNAAPILLVENDPADFDSTIRSLRDADTANPIFRCERGDEALEFLNSTQSLPGLILLELDLPEMDGRQVLSEIKQCPRLKRIPVIVFTSSPRESDARLCYEHGANGYVHKPDDPAEFRRTIERLRDFWLGVATLPTDPA